MLDVDVEGLDLAPRDGRPPLLVIIGPSGTGKTTLARQLVAWSRTLRLIPTLTTRSPRQLDMPGELLYFSSTDFDEAFRAGRLFQYNIGPTVSYGYSKAHLADTLARGHAGILLFRSRGGVLVCDRVPRALAVFLDAPLPVLTRRLAARGGEIIEHADLEGARERNAKAFETFRLQGRPCLWLESTSRESPSPEAVAAAARDFWRRHGGAWNAC